MGRPAITYDGVLMTLNKHFLWNYTTIRPGCRDKISFSDFKKILIMEKVTTSKRKVLEIWDLMEELDFFSKVNNSDVRIVDLVAVARVLGFPIEDGSPRKTDSESNAGGTEGCLAE